MHEVWPLISHCADDYMQHCISVNCLSSTGSWLLENWSRCVHIGCTNLMQRSWRRTLISRSCFARSATGVLFTFFSRLTSIVIQCFLRTASSTKALNSADQSQRVGRARARSWWPTGRVRLVMCHALSSSVDAVSDVTHFPRTKIICLLRLIISVIGGEWNANCVRWGGCSVLGLHVKQSTLVTATWDMFNRFIYIGSV